MPRYSRRRKIRWSRVLSCAFAAILLTAAVGILIQVSAEFPLSAADRESSQTEDGTVSLAETSDVSAAASATLVPMRPQAPQRMIFMRVPRCNFR